MKNTSNKAAQAARQLLLGAHLSIVGGPDQALYRAESLGCNVLQIFTKNASTWKERILDEAEGERFLRARSATGVRVVASHAAYLINPASPDKEKHRLSRDALIMEMNRCAVLGIDFLVLHPGSHAGSGEGEGIRRITETVDEVLSAASNNITRLLLETMAGQGAGVGERFEALAAVLDGLSNKDRTGICLDTCHVFAAGYDIRTPFSFKKTLDRFDQVLGLDRLFLIHVNDSKKGLGSRVDRHEHIGLGAIGFEAFSSIMNDRRLFHVPKIIETPKGERDEGWDRVNLGKLRGLVRDQRSEVRDQRSEVRGQRSEIRGQKLETGNSDADT